MLLLCPPCFCVDNGRIMNRNHSSVIDALLIAIVVLLGVMVFSTLVLQGLPGWGLYLSLGGLAGVAMALALARWITRPDQLRAQQSHRILEIADESLAHLRRGLGEETAQAVCRIVLERTDAAAVAITDTERILGFSGIGEGHHLVGSRILTEATRAAVHAERDARCLRTREEDEAARTTIACCGRLRGSSARARAPGGEPQVLLHHSALPERVQLAMAEGLAGAALHPLELAQLDHQTALACRMELKALQAQIFPHFLFNTVNTIASLIRQIPRRTGAATRVRGLLRSLTRDERRPRHTRAGMDYVRAYSSSRRRASVTVSTSPSTWFRRTSVFSCPPSPCSRSWRTRSSTACARISPLSTSL